MALTKPAIVFFCVVAALSLQPAAGGELLQYRDNRPLPALELPDLGGRPHRLSDYRGQVVLVNFWASWCPPCLAEMPSMQRLSEALKGRPFKILAVNLEESKSTVWKFRKLLNVSFSTLLDIFRKEGDIPLYPSFPSACGESEGAGGMSRVVWRQR